MLWKPVTFYLLLLAQLSWVATSFSTEQRTGIGPHDDQLVTLTMDTDGTEQEEEESFEDHFFVGSSESAYLKACNCGRRRNRHDDRICFLDGLVREPLASRPPPLS